MVSNPFSDGLSVEINGDSSGLEGAVDNAVASLGTLKKAAGGAGAAIAALSAGGFAKAANDAADFEQAMADVEKVTNAETAEELQEPIQDLAEDVPLAAEEIANLSAQAGRFGAEGAEEIESFTETAAEMGAATTLSADEAGRSLAKVATALGEPLDNVDQLGDSINELSNNFATNSQEIVDAAQRGGFAVQEMGMTSDETLGLASALNEVYPSARRAGNAMKQVGEAMTDPDNVASFAEALDVTEEEFRQMREENPDETLLQVAEAMEESDEASEILSDQLTSQQTRAFQRVSQQSDEVRGAMEQSNEAMEEGGSLAREVAIETDTFHGKLELLKSQINNVFREIGKNFLPILTDLLGDVSDAVDQFSRLNDETDGMLGTITLVTGAVGGLGAALLFLAGGPITAVVGGVAALAGAFATDFMGIRTAVMDVVETIQNQFVPAPDEMARALERAEERVQSAMQRMETGIQAAVDRVEQAIAQHGDKVRAVMDTIYGGAERIVRDTLGTIQGFWSNHSSDIIGIIENLATLISSVLEQALSTAYSLWQSHGEDVISTVERFISLVLDVISGLAGTIVSVLGPVLDQLTQFWKQHGEEIALIVETMANIVISTVTWLTNKLIWLFEGFYTLASGLWNRLGDEIVATIEFATDLVLSILGTALDAMATAIRTTTAIMQGDWETAWDEIAGFFKRILNGLVDFLKEWGGRFLDWITDPLDNAVSKVKDWDLPGEIKSKASDAVSKLKTEISNLKDRVETALSDAVDKVTSWDLPGDIKSKAESAISDFEEKFDLVGAVESAISAAQSKIDSWTPDWPDLSPPDIKGGGGDGDDGGDGGAVDWATDAIRGMASGGFVKNDGLVKLHAGERVLSEDEIDRNPSGGAGTTIKIDKIQASGPREGREAGRAFVDELRSAGFRS